MTEATSIGPGATPAGGLMAGKKGLVMGLANDKSIAWGICQALRAQGADLAISYQGGALEKRVKPLAEKLGLSDDRLLTCDATDPESVKGTIETTADLFGGSFDFIVHAIGFSDKEELKGKYLNTSKENFLFTMDVSCWSFTEVAKAAEPFMNRGGSMITLTYLGSMMVLPNYNVMGVAKAALEASVRYLAHDFGPAGVRVNGLSAGAIRTLAASGIGDFKNMLKWSELTSPMRQNVSIDDVGNAALYLLSDWAAGVTGQIHYVDAGANTQGMFPIDEIEPIAALASDMAARKKAD